MPTSSPGDSPPPPSRSTLEEIDKLAAERLSAARPADPMKAFRDAVRAKDAAGVSALLAAEPAVRAVVNDPLFDFDAPAVVFARRESSVVAALVAGGADVNRKTTWWAGPWGVLDDVDRATGEKLIALGATIDLFAAANLNKLDVARTLLDADPSLVHSKGGDGGRPLHFARTPEMVDLLLERGAEIDARDLDHAATAAQWAIPSAKGVKDAAKLAVVRRLIQRGARVDPFMAAAVDDADRLAPMIDVGGLDVQIGGPANDWCPEAKGGHIYLYTLCQGSIPADVAEAFDSVAVLRLIDERATPKTRFLAACRVGDRVAAERLMASDPLLLQSLTATDQNTLPYAAWMGNLRAVTLMLDLGFDPMARALEGATALHNAAWHGRLEIVLLILSYSATASRRAEMVAATENTFRSTPLGWCCHGSRFGDGVQADYAEIAQLLLAAGGSPGPNADDASPAVAAVLGTRPGRIS